jgi:nucleoside 2-deoxyribosyltransferase
MSEHIVQRKEYKIFLSCEDDIKIGNNPIEKLLKEHIRKKNVDIDIKCIKRHENVKSAMQDLKYVKENCVYVINTHRDLDNTAYWQLGYAMGRGIEIIGYYDGKNEKNIHEDVNTLTNQFHSDNSTRFLKMISDHITKTIEVFFDEWDNLYDLSKKELEAN